MTLRHKIKLVFCRITWWFRLTEKARNHYRVAQDFYYLYDLYNQISVKYIETHRKQREQKLIQELKGQVELLKIILGIKE